MIPFDREFARAARRSSSTTCWSGGSAPAGVGGRELPLRPPGRRATPAAARAASSRRAWRRWSRSRARSSPPATSAASWRPATWSTAAAFLGGPFRLAGPVVEGDRRGRELGIPTANLVPDDALRGARATASTPAAGARPPRGRQRRRAPHLRDRSRPADRGLPARLRRRPLRPRAAVEFLARLRGERRFEARGRARRADARATSQARGRRVSRLLLRFRADDAHRRAQAELVSKLRPGRRRHRLAPRCRSRC